MYRCALDSKLKEKEMKKTTIRLSLATLAVLASTSLVAEAVAEGPQIVQSGETIKLNGTQSVAEHGGKIESYTWIQENLSSDDKKSTKGKYNASLTISTKPTVTLIAPEVNRTTKFRYTLVTDEVIHNKNGFTMTVEPNNAGGNTTITHEGFTYHPVVSPITGRTWLDRNLGASKVCTSLHDTDEACYGAYYQWGRNTDGHQLHDSPLGSTLPSLDTVSNKFISGDAFGAGGGFYDWVNEDSNGTIREARWSATDGSSVCPVGYRVPTPEEYRVETNLDFLHLSYAGLRTVDEPNYHRDDALFLWTSHMTRPERAEAYVATVRFGEGLSTRIPVDGFAVRCIKN